MGVPGLFGYLRRRYPEICSVPDPPRRRGGAAGDTIDPTGHSGGGAPPPDNLYIDMWARPARERTPQAAVPKGRRL